MFCRLILAFRIRPTSDLKSRPILDALDCNSIMASWSTQPKPFKVGYVPRDKAKLEQWIEQSLRRIICDEAWRVEMEWTDRREKRDICRSVDPNCACLISYLT